MNVAFTAPLTVEEFLAWGREQELCHEFDGREAIPRAGGTLRHGRIGLKLAMLLETHLGNGPCRAFSDGIKIVVAGRVRYRKDGVLALPAIGVSFALALAECCAGINGP